MSEATLSPRRYATARRLAEVLVPEGHGLPGAARAECARRLDDQLASWDPPARAGVGWMLVVLEMSPLFSRHRRRFTKLDDEAALKWFGAGLHSRVGALRMSFMALKQLVFLAWAAAPEVEDELSYDYRCARDDEPHGAGRTVIGAPLPWRPPSEPHDYARKGPAVAAGSVPVTLQAKKDFRPVDPEDTKLATIEWPEIADGFRDEADVVIIGSGAGGAVAAHTLAATGARVVVVEEGRSVSSEEDFVGPMFSRFQRLCRDNATSLVWGRPPMPLPLGKVVGGTTVVNSGTCFRPPSKVLTRWASEHALHEFGPPELEPHLAAIEEALNVRAVPWELLGPNGFVAHRGALELGYSGGPLLRNIADCHGCGQCAFGCPTDAKQAMHISYLPRAQRAGTVIYSRCRVDRVALENGRARGVSASLLDDRGRRRGRMEVAAKHVIVSAGAIHSPPLLEASGVPDPSGQTGKNLRVHPATGVSGQFDEDWVGWKGTLQSYYIDEFFDSHELMFEATSAIPSIGAGSVAGVGADAIEELKTMSHLATLGFYVSDTSSGTVRRVPGGRVIASYRLNRLDTRRLAKGYAVATQVLLAAGAKKVVTGIPGRSHVDSPRRLDDLERAVRRDHLRLTAFHPMGTVRMGGDPEHSVVDSYGRHHAVHNLWVADASVFPSCVGVNPQMSIMALAKRTAERVSNELA